MGKINTLKERRIVIVGNYWPYVPGGTRIFTLAPELAKAGWKVDIFTMPLTRQPIISQDDISVHQIAHAGDIFTPFRKILKKFYRHSSQSGLKHAILYKDRKYNASLKAYILNILFNLYQEVFGYPDTEKFWYTNLYNALKRHLQSSGADIILSEHPVISHIVAKRIASEYHIPWVADFVDLWSLNHNYQYSRLRGYFDRKLERKTLGSAQAIVTTSVLWRDRLHRLHGKNRAIYAIPHSYQADIFNNDQMVADDFFIVFSGKYYKDFQNAEPFFYGLSQFLKHHPESSGKIRVNFYTEPDASLEHLAQKHGILSCCHFKNYLPKEEIIQVQRNAQILLLFAASGKEAGGSIPLKTYDYCAARRPILSVGGNQNRELDLVNDLLSTTNAGTQCMNGDDVYSYLKLAWEQYLDNGIVTYNGEESKVRVLDSTHMASKFEDVFVSHMR